VHGSRGQSRRDFTARTTPIVGTAPALCKVMVMRFLLISSGVLLLASTGAFFLFVPPLWIATVVLMLVGLTSMFGLGFHLGGQGMVPSETARNHA